MSAPKTKLFKKLDKDEVIKISPWNKKLEPRHLSSDITAKNGIYNYILIHRKENFSYL